MATVIFKPTEACNSRCIYCDVVYRKTPGPKRMTFETLETFFRRVNEFLLERPQERMRIIWHGGEPLLLGPGYFERALRYQEKHCSGTVTRIRHLVQSNLTLLSREFLDPMRKLGVANLGTSYDPIDHIRGLGEKRDSLTYKKRFMEAICLLEEEGFNWGVIYVVTKYSLSKPLEIFNFLTNLSPQKKLKFHPVLVNGCGLDHIKVSPTEYTEFLGAIFRPGGAIAMTTVPLSLFLLCCRIFVMIARHWRAWTRGPVPTATSGCCRMAGCFIAAVRPIGDCCITAPSRKSRSPRFFPIPREKCCFDVMRFFRKRSARDAAFGISATEAAP